MTQSRIGNIKWGPKEKQDDYPRHGIYKLSDGITSFHGCGIGFCRRGN